MKERLARLVNTLPRHIIGPGLISLAIKLAGAVLAYGMVVAFARFMTAEEYGRFAFGLNLAIIAAAFASLGFSTGIMRYWPKYMVANDQQGAKSAVLLGYRINAIGGSIIILLSFLAGLYTYFIAGKNNFAEYLAIGLLGLLIAIGDYSTNLLRAQGSTIVSMLPRDVFWRIGSVVLAGTTLLFGFAVTGPVALAICALVLAFLNLWQISTAQKNLPIIEKANRNDWPELRKSLLPFWASGIIFAMIQQFDVVIVGSLLGSADAGAYFAAQKTAMLLSLVLIAAGIVSAPTMASLYHGGKLAELQKLCRNLSVAIAVITIFGFGFILILGPSLLTLFDPAYASAYPILVIVAFGCMVDAIAGPSAYLMQMTSFERSYLRIMAVCYILVIIAQVVLIPRCGALGAAVASSGGVVVWNIWSIFTLRNKAGLDPSLLSIFLPPKQSHQS
jgi:O-antigen/teichoic acid export membrane protein